MSIDKRKVDSEAENEGAAVNRQRDLGNLRVQGGRKRQRSIEDLQAENVRKNYTVQPERPRNSFRKTGI